MRSILTAAAVILVSSAALANEPSSHTPRSVPDLSAAMPSNGDWAGFYLGLQTGSGTAYRNFDGDRGDLGGLTARGIHGGHQTDFGRLVTGTEVDAHTVKLENTGNRHKLLRFKTTLGVDLGRFNPYGIFGTAYAIPEETTLTPSFGLAYGLGANLKLTEHLMVGLEYTSQTFEDFDGFPGLEVEGRVTQFRTAFRF